MGTRLVYDYQQQKWIPYVSDPDKWYQHLLDVRDGYAERDSQDIILWIVDGNTECWKKWNKRKNP